MDHQGPSLPQPPEDVSGTISLKKKKKALKKKGKGKCLYRYVHPVASATREEVLRAALLASVSGRPFEDVKFFVFSRRARDGTVDSPLPVLANTALLRKASSHFDYLFAQAGFAENEVVNIDAPYPTTRSQKSTDYDYESDSDLEDEIDDEDDVAVPHQEQQDGEERMAGMTGANSGAEIQPPKPAPEDDEQASCGTRNPSQSLKLSPAGKRGQVVFLEGVAHKTFKAFVSYAYLGEDVLCFAPLRSECKASPQDAGSDQHQRACSPKSLYRLAERYDIQPLKALCTKAIKTQLHPHNILEEIFSTFTSLYPEIQDLELEYLKEHMHEQMIMDTLPSWISAFAKGQLPPSAERVIFALIISRSPSHSATASAFASPPPFGLFGRK